MPFLDVYIILTRDKYDKNLYYISTDIYLKPTDTFNYFPFNSCPPRHISKNIPYNLARRITNIVSETNTREHRFNELRKRLIDKKYPINLINDSINKAKLLDRETLINSTKRPKEDNLVTLVIDHNPRREDPSHPINFFVNHSKKYKK